MEEDGIMANKVTTLIDVSTQDELYPRTKASAVSDNDGNTLGNVAVCNYTVAGSGVNPINVGIVLDLLWTNSAPTSSFSAQTVSVDLTEYALVIIEFRIDNSSNNNTFSNVCASYTKYTANIGGQPTSSQAQIWRAYTVSGSGIAFDVGGAGGSTNNQYCIPLYIYGVR